MTRRMEKTHINTIIIGGGPAGVTCGYQLVRGKMQPFQLSKIKTSKP